MKPKNLKPVIRAKLEEISSLQKQLRLNDSELARMACINPSQVTRVKKEEQMPGETFIAGMLIAFPEKTFYDLFFLEKPMRESIDEQSATLEPTGTEGR